MTTIEQRIEKVLEFHDIDGRTTQTELDALVEDLAALYPPQELDRNRIAMIAHKHNAKGCCSIGFCEGFADEIMAWAEGTEHEAKPSWCKEGCVDPIELVDGAWCRGKPIHGAVMFCSYCGTERPRPAGKER